MISESTLNLLQNLGHQIQQDTSAMRQRSINICWHWWNVGKTICSDPSLQRGKGTGTISNEDMIEICAALGLSTVLSKTGRPNGGVAVRRAVDTFKRFPDEDDAKKAIEMAGTYHVLSLGTGYGGRLARSMSVPVSLLDLMHRETGVKDKAARRYIADYLRDPEVQESIVAYAYLRSRKTSKKSTG